MIIIHGIIIVGVDIMEEKTLNKADIILYLILNTYFLDMNSRYSQDTYKTNYIRTLNELNRSLKNGPKATKENYDKMINIISILRYIDVFSLTKDEVFDYIEAKNIEIPERWFVDKKDKKIFSGKNILKFLRDAFSHSNINELYKITKDGQYIIIDMKGTKPKPLNLIIPKNDIEILVKYINFSSSTYSTTGMEIDNSKDIDPNDLSSFFDRFNYVRFLYTQKIVDGNSLEYRAALSRVDSNNFQKLMLEKANQFGAKKIVHELTKTQKKEMLRKFKEIASRTEILSNGKQLTDFIIYYMRIILPIGIYKAAFNQNENILIYDNFISNLDNSNNEYNLYMQRIVDEYMSNYGKKQTGNLLYDSFGNNTDTINLILKYISDLEARNMNNIALLASFYFRTVDSQENFECGEKILPVNRIRNAFVHGRWGIGENGGFHLYDWPGGIKNELNPTWEDNIAVEDLLNGIRRNFFKSFNMSDINIEDIDLFKPGNRKIGKL